MEGFGFYKVITGMSSRDSKKFPGILAAIFITIAGLMIFQDYLESLRKDHTFYFGESLLFKTIWFLFIPILVVLYKKLKKQGLDSFQTTGLFIIVPVFIHFLLLPIVFLFFSVLFYEGRYDLYKILSYTLANDLYILIIVYSTFVLGYKYLSKSASAKLFSEEKTWLKTLVIRNGKDNRIVNISEIVQIVASTPYVEVHMDNRKYLHTATLRSINELLDQNNFIRVHKSAIVNIHQIFSFKSRLNGDYDLKLKNGQITRLSRTYAANFKKHFESANQVSQ